MLKKFYIFLLLITFAFAITGFSDEGYEGIQFDFIPGDTYMHTAEWVNDRFSEVSNRIDIVETNLYGLGVDVTNKYNFVTFWLTGLGISLTNFIGEVQFSTNDIHQRITREVNQLETNIQTNIVAVNSNLANQGLALTNLTTNFWLFYTNVWDAFLVTTNRMDELHGLIETNAGIVKTNFETIGFAITNIQNNISTNFPQIHSNIEAISNYTENVEGQVLTNYEYMTNALQSATNRMDGIDETIQTFQEQTSSALESATNRMDSIQGIIETNYEFTTNILTNIIISVENNASDIADLTTSVSDILTNTIPGITNNLGITVIGAETADSEYQDIDNISRVKFDKDSGFTITTNELNEKEVEISLGSAWTTLVPDIEQINPETDEPYPNLRPSGEETLNVKVIVTNETGTFWDYSNTNKNEKTFYIGIGQEIAGDIPYEKVYTTDEIVVTNLNYPIGRYTNGAVIAENTSLKTIFGNMFTTVKPPTYRSPVFSIIPFTSASYFEYGNEFSGGTVVSGQFIPWDSGPVQQYEYVINNSTVDTIETDFTDIAFTNSFFNLTNSMTFGIRVYWTDGPIKPDSDGVPYPEGQIKAGNDLKSFTISPTRYMYWGNNSIPVQYETPATIYVLPNKRLVERTASLTIPLPKGTRQTVLAVPVNHVTISSINFSNNFVNVSILNNVEITDMDGFMPENGFTGPGASIEYKIYDYKSSSPIEEDNTDFIVIRYTSR